MQFLKAAKAAIDRHGEIISYINVSVPVYNAFSGAATSTETPNSIKSYPKHVVTNQYNLPNLIGKRVIEFYIYAPDLAIRPKPNDKIVYQTEGFAVIDCVEHRALGQVLLYKVIAVRG